LKQASRKGDWRVKFDIAAAKELKKLGTAEQRRILKFLRKRIAGSDDPRRLGTALNGEFAGLWRDRIGDYRLLAKIEDGRFGVLIVRVGQHREICR
jgi:mRNA interferase RelE/StbE